MQICEMVKEFRNKYLSLWWDAEPRFPYTGREIGNREKREKEREVDQFIREFIDDMNHYPEDRQAWNTWERNMRDKAVHFARESLNIRENYIDVLSSDGFVDSTYSFVHEAKGFDPSIKIEDIFQAIRNVWIMNSLQVLLNLEISYSSAMFAYSMLYPYTDNYLDNPFILPDVKMKFNEKFQKRLMGIYVNGANFHEKSVFHMIDRIEEQYPRCCFSQVYGSLCAINNAQNRSLLQQRGRKVPYEVDILGISLEKGGTSVLADGYLVKGILEVKEAEFIFGFGCLLQLLDDLQDVSSDIKNGHMTIFSQVALKWPLDHLANRLFGFIDRVLEEDTCFTAAEAVNIKGLIKENCMLLALGAIAQNKELYTKDYIKRVEKLSLYRFVFIKKIKARLMKQLHRIRDLDEKMELQWTYKQNLFF